MPGGKHCAREETLCQGGNIVPGRKQFDVLPFYIVG